MVDRTGDNQLTSHPTLEDEGKCIACDTIIPEGRQVCPNCETKKEDWNE